MTFEEHLERLEPVIARLEQLSLIYENKFLNRPIELSRENVTVEVE